MSLFALSPSRGPRWQLGLQAALGIAVPIAVMTLLGQPMLGYIAASGAFTVLFAGSLPAVERAHELPAGAVDVAEHGELMLRVGHVAAAHGVGVVADDHGVAQSEPTCQLRFSGPLCLVRHPAPSAEAAI